MSDEQDKVALVELYDHYRTARMNCIYYEMRLRALQRWNFVIEVFVALGTSGGIAGLTLWGYGPFRHIWTALATLGAFAACIKPLLGLSKLIEQCSSQRQRYLENFFSADRLIKRIKVAHTMTNADHRMFEGIVDRFHSISLHDVVPVKHRVLSRAMDKVLVEIPTNSLWMPG